MNNKPVCLNPFDKGSFMYFETITKTSAQKFKIGQMFSSPIWDGIWKVVAFSDKRIAVVRVDK